MIKVRPYEGEHRREGIEVDIRFRWPCDGSKFRKRFRAPVKTEAQARRWGEDLERRIIAGGKDGPLARSKRPPTKKGSAPACETFTSSETVSTWFGRYYAWREGRPRGAESVGDSRGRFKKWIEPKLGAIAMVDVTRDMLEDFVAFLDEQADEEVIATKTAINIWGEVTAGFRVATRCKDKSLRVLKTNPAADVDGPDKSDDKQKPFLRPEELVKLLGCTDVPRERRYVYAFAVYTAMRQAEMRALRVRDIDFDAMQIMVARQLRDGVEKERTKGGRARVVQIEPNLLPLLRRLVRGKQPDDLVLWVAARNRCASNLRADLLTAGCTREALHVATKTTAHLKFHNLRDTCGVHMAMRRDAPHDIQWRLGHTDLRTTEIYISNARYQAGSSFGEPLPPLPVGLTPAIVRESGETVEKVARA